MKRGVLREILDDVAQGKDLVSIFTAQHRSPARVWEALGILASMGDSALFRKVASKYRVDSSYLLHRVQGLIRQLEELKEEDPYSLLGVEYTASPAEIHKSWKKLMQEWHPDRRGGDPRAQEMCRRINEAYELLKDKDKRREYDRRFMPLLFVFSKMEENTTEDMVCFQVTGRRWLLPGLLGVLVVFSLLGWFFFRGPGGTSLGLFRGKVLVPPPRERVETVGRGNLHLAQKHKIKEPEISASPSDTLENGNGILLSLLTATHEGSLVEFFPAFGFSLESKSSVRLPVQVVAVAERAPSSELGVAPVPRKKMVVESDRGAEIKGKTQVQSPKARVRKSPSERSALLRRAGITVLAGSFGTPRRSSAPSVSVDGEGDEGISNKPFSSRLENRNTSPGRMVQRSSPRGSVSEPPGPVESPKVVDNVKPALQVVIPARKAFKIGSGKRLSQSEEIGAAKEARAQGNSHRGNVAAKDEKTEIKKLSRRKRTRTKTISLAEFSGTPLKSSALSKTDQIKKPRAVHKLSPFSVVARFIQAYKKEDLGCLLSLFTRDAQENGQPVARYMDRYRQFFKAFEVVDYRLTEKKVIPCKCGVKVQGLYLVSMVPRSGGNLHWVKGSVAWTLVKDRGKWLISSLDYTME